jgi:hypothetical protein|tara:strand:+ start:450 stop:554 length:105 start_codon:yes stop_codon:yes gene_type:complete
MKMDRKRFKEFSRMGNKFVLQKNGTKMGLFVMIE